ncbi:MAG: hypothetical protein WC760_06430 [Bacteroidia bacterium]|jgi:hypothetical protein
MLNLQKQMENNQVRVHYNRMQLRALMVYAKILTDVAGRGTGKSTGVIAPRMANCCIQMPYSNNGLLSKTYKQTKTRTLPAIKVGWTILGFKEGIHYVIGKKADKKLRFDMPQEAPDDWEHVIHWFTGAIISMSSQDRKNDSNGLNLQSLHGDEAKLLDKEDLDESIMPTLRGMIQYEDKIEYRMQTWTTDMPTTPEAQWILKSEENCDPDAVQLIEQLQLLIQERRISMNLSTSETYRIHLAKDIARYQRQIHTLRSDLFHYMEATSFDNIDMLGKEYIETQRRLLPDFVFETSILNRRPKGLEKGDRFYHKLSQANFYTDFNYTYLDKFPAELPDDKDKSVADLDCNPDQPLDIVIDWGKINSLLVGQEDKESSRYNILKEFYALREDDEIIHNLIDKFSDYYSLHTARTIYVYYDRNGNTSVANSKETYAELVQRLLYDKGWHPRLMSFDENPGHRDKYEFLNIALSGNERRLPKVRINEENCPNLLIAMYNTPIKISSGELQKDKSSERSRVIPQQQATHITDCFDILYFSKFRDNMEEMSGHIGLIGMKQ